MIDDNIGNDDRAAMDDAAHHDLSGKRSSSLEVFKLLRNKSSMMHSNESEKLPTLRHTLLNTNEATVKKCRSKRRSSWESILLPNDASSSTTRDNDWEKVKDEFMGKSMRHQ